jgi:hypothetical protein
MLSGTLEIERLLGKRIRLPSKHFSLLLSGPYVFWRSGAFELFPDEPRNALSCYLRGERS